MSELLYYTDPYLEEVEATVREIRDGKVVFDKTIFYPECGGQPGDRGFFGGRRIVDTRKGDDGTPLSVFEGELPEVGEKAILSLDWDHRYFYMKEHTAQHLLSSVLFYLHNIGTVAVHQGEEVLTIETDRSDISDAELLSVEEEAMDRVFGGLRVWQEDMERDKALSLNMRRSIKVDGDFVKVVFIEGEDAVACGGVHVASTSEIGEICCRGKETIRGRVRTIWSIGKNAVSYRRENERAVKNAGKLLSADSSALAGEVERIIGENTALKRELREARRDLLENELMSKVLSRQSVYSTKYPLDDMPQIVSSLSSDNPVFVAEDGGKKSFVFYGKKEVFERIKESGMIKGGGREPLFRGTVLSDTASVLDKVQTILN
ncbi:MAG: alanyl-tRNA editing protein [Candidatus Ornithospirochaeta sp.]